MNKPFPTLTDQNVAHFSTVQIAMTKNLVYVSQQASSEFFAHQNQQRSPETTEQFRASNCDVLIRHKTHPESIYLAHGHLDLILIVRRTYVTV